MWKTLLETRSGQGSRIGRLAILLLITALFTGCGDDGPTETDPPETPPATGYLGYDGCKTFWDAMSPQSGPLPASECLVYSYDGSSVLEITHVNAVFNCCPDPLVGTISVSDDVITLTESGENLCDCLCPFDLSYRLVDIEPGVYTLQVTGIDDLTFTFDLSTAPTGQNCVERSGYPWDVTAVNGQITGYDGCKLTVDPNRVSGSPVTEDCIQYSYDGEGTLELVHVNALFNCCVENLDAEISFEDNRITVVENETLENGSGCRCFCQYDVSYEIRNLPPGEYLVLVEELYLYEQDPPLEFTVELFAATTGQYCLGRGEPW